MSMVFTQNIYIQNDGFKFTLNVNSKVIREHTDTILQKIVNKASLKKVTIFDLNQMINEVQQKNKLSSKHVNLINKRLIETLSTPKQFAYKNTVKDNILQIKGI